MDVIFVDDAAQKAPSRPGMGSHLGIGGIHVPEESQPFLTAAVRQLHAVWYIIDLKAKTRKEKCLYFPSIRCF